MMVMAVFVFLLDWWGRCRRITKKYSKGLICKEETQTQPITCDRTCGSRCSGEIQDTLTLTLGDFHRFNHE